MRAFIVAAAVAAIVSPAVANNSYVCLVGKANDTLAMWMKGTDQWPVLKFNLDMGGEPWPAILLGKSDGTFSLVMLMNGKACVLVTGNGMALAPLDLKFPVAELPGSPS